MKKRTWILFVTAALVFAGAAEATFTVLAENGIESRGELALEGEEMDICTADIANLQSGLGMLNNELTNLPGTDTEIPADRFVRRAGIRSKGIIDYDNGTVVIDSSDFISLADEMDALEYVYKTVLINALNQIGTYFMEDGSVTYNQDNACDFMGESAEMLSFDKLYNGILTSQSVAHLADRQAVNGSGELLFYASEAAQNENSLVMPTTAENGFPLLIQASGAANLSAGAAAWVNGKLLIGNGADNTAFYNQGYVDGFNEIMDSVGISYVYHEHTGSADAGDGCYTSPVYHSHSSSCYTSVPVTPAHKSTCAWHHETDAWGNLITMWDCDCSYSKQVLNCSRGSEIVGWNLGCGKTTSTIESATLTFQ